jgi:hypothetical protein
VRAAEWPCAPELTIWAWVQSMAVAARIGNAARNRVVSDGIEFSSLLRLLY